jgi:hypothetical protein
VAIKGSPYKKYSPADIALLEDPAKRQLYIEAHASCIAPRYREVAAILSFKSALMENPPPSYLDGAFPADGVDWTKVSGGSLTNHMLDMGAFAHAWAPLERRWEAEGVAAFIHATALHVHYLMPHVLLATTARPRILSGWQICHLNWQTSPECSPSSRTRDHDLHEDDQHGRREGGRAPGRLERRPREAPGTR